MILSQVTKIIPPTSPPSVSSLLYEAWSVVLTLEHCDRLSATTVVFLVRDAHCLFHKN